MQSEPATPYRTSSHVFVAHDGMMLTLQQAHGWRWWELPGGNVESGEPPGDAAVRETLEETGLRIGPPELLRTWSYQNNRGRLVDCYAFVAEAPSGVIRLSNEHTAHEWMTVDDHADRYCGEQLSGNVPWLSEFLAAMRKNCALFSAWQRSATNRC